MGYVHKPTIFVLDFDDDTRFPGLHLRTRGLSIAGFADFGIRLSKVIDGIQDAPTHQQLAALPELAEALGELRVMFVEALLDWNQETPEGEPIPCTLEGLAVFDDDDFFDLINEWTTQIGGVSRKLGKDSGSGGTSPELSDLMAPL